MNRKARPKPGFFCFVSACGRDGRLARRAAFGHEAVEFVLVLGPAQLVDEIAEGALFNADITPDLMAAVEELSAIKERGGSVPDALAQAGMFGDKLTPEARDLLVFLDDNLRSPRRIAEFIQRYNEALAAAGNPNQGSLLGDATAPVKGDLMTAAKRGTNGDATEDTSGGQPGKDEGAGAEDKRQPTHAQGNRGGNEGDEAQAGTDVAARDRAAADFSQAMGDLGALLRDHAHVARMIPEDTPGLMDVLVCRLPSASVYGD